MSSTYSIITCADANIYYSQPELKSGNAMIIMASYFDDKNALRATRTPFETESAISTLLKTEETFPQRRHRSQVLEDFWRISVEAENDDSNAWYPNVPELMMVAGFPANFRDRKDKSVMQITMRNSNHDYWHKDLTLDPQNINLIYVGIDAYQETEEKTFLTMQLVSVSALIEKYGLHMIMAELVANSASSEELTQNLNTVYDEVLKKGADPEADDELLSLSDQRKCRSTICHLLVL